MTTLKELAANPGTVKLEFDISVSMPAQGIPAQWLNRIDMNYSLMDLGEGGTWDEAEASRWIYKIVNRMLSQSAGMTRVLPLSKFLFDGGGSAHTNQWAINAQCAYNQRGKINFAEGLTQVSISEVQITAHIGAGKEAMDSAPDSPLWGIEPNTPLMVDRISCTIENVMVNGANAEEIQQPGGAEEDNPNAPLTIRGYLMYANWVQTDTDAPAPAQMKDDSPEWAKAFVYEPLSRAIGMEINEDNCAFGPEDMPGKGAWQVNYPVSQWQTEPAAAESVSCINARIPMALFNLPPDSIPVKLRMQKPGDDWKIEEGLNWGITYNGRSI